MSGQISIRLPDETIKRLNRAARKSKKKRAEILRAAIEVGLNSLEKPKSSTAVEKLEDMHDDLRARLSQLEGLIQNVVEEPTTDESDASKIPTAMTDEKNADSQSEIAPISEAVSEPNESASRTEQSGHVKGVGDAIELLPADSTEGDSATMILAPEIIDTEAGVTDSPAKSKRAEFYESDTGELQADRRVRDTVIDIDPETDQRISSRLRRARIRKGWDIATLGAELNMKAELLEDIENGRCDVPRSRGIRVEAKLQQWEWEAEMNA